jgi:hypothetical protein
VRACFMLERERDKEEENEELGRAISRVENSSQGPSCQLKFVHGGMLRVHACFMLARVRNTLFTGQRKRKRNRDRGTEGRESERE